MTSSTDNATTRLHLGLVGPLPPVPSGPADYLAELLPALAQRVRLTCFVPDVTATDDALRAKFDVQPISARDNPDVDLLHYHLANNEHHEAVFEAALVGPPGLAVIHDGSVHHLAAHLMLTGGSPDRYREFLREAHGEAGAELAQLRIDGHRAQIEQFLFDALGAVVSRHHGALVHSRYAADLVSSRVPGLPVWVVPHYARPMAPPLNKASFGVDEDVFTIGHFGFITAPKRPYLLLDAFARLLRAGHRAHLLLAGKDDTFGRLSNAIAASGLTEHVTVTGYLEAAELEGLIQAVDTVVSLRSPHVAETSGTLTLALVAGKPVVVQQLGSWAELPASVAVQVAADGDEAAALADAFVSLAIDPERRRRLGEAAKDYATHHFDLDRCADAIIAASTTAASRTNVTPRAFGLERREAIAASSAPTSLRALPPAFAGARCLALETTPTVTDALADLWGYDVSAHRVGQPRRAGSFDAVVWTPAAPNIVALDAMHAQLSDINRLLAGNGWLLVYDAEETDTETSDWSPPWIAVLELAGFAVRSSTAGVLAQKVALPAKWRSARVSLVS